METYTIPYVTWMTNASLMHEAGHPKLVLWENLGGWGGEAGGRGSGWRGHRYACGRFIWIYGKNHHKIVK